MSSPPSVPPSGVPESGNAKYAVVAILLVLGAGGIYAWRAISSHGGAQAPQVVLMPSASSSAMAATPNAKLDDIPPAPPEEEKPEAGLAPRVAIGGGGLGGCEKTCVGSATAELTGALEVRGQQARRCYNQALVNDSSLKGHVTIQVRIGPAGNACSASVHANDMGTPSVANCAMSIFRNASYPAPHGGCVDVEVPLSFVPQGQ